MDKNIKLSLSLFGIIGWREGVGGYSEPSEREIKTQRWTIKTDL